MRAKNQPQGWQSSFGGIITSSFSCCFNPKLHVFKLSETQTNMDMNFSHGHKMYEFSVFVLIPAP